MKSPLTTADFTLSHGLLVTEASDLGIRAADPMPSSLVIDGITYRYLRTTTDRDGDVVSWQYQSANQVAVVYND